MADKNTTDTRPIQLTNLARDIKSIEGFMDIDGKPIVLGSTADRGVMGAHSPTATVTLAQAKKLSEHPVVGTWLAAGELSLGSRFDA